MLSELGVSEDANLASAWGLQSALEIREQRIRLTDQLREQGVSPSKIPATVDKMLQPFRKELHEIDTDPTDVYQIFSDAVATLKKVSPLPHSQDCQYARWLKGAKNF